MRRVELLTLIPLLSLACSTSPGQADSGESSGTSGPTSSSTGETTDGETGTGETTATSETTTGETTTGEPDDPCMRSPATGDCDGAFVRWYFNAETGTCEEFSWGGCGGVVPFETLGDCLGACEPCEAVLAQPAAAQIPVTIRNELDVPIYVNRAQPRPEYGPGYFASRAYVLWDESEGEPLRLADSLCGDTLTCSGYAETCGGCDPGPPYEPPPIKIDPGVSYMAKPWDGNALTTASVRNECLPDPCEPTPGDETFTCEFVGPYPGFWISASAEGSTELAGDDCDVGPEGWCVTGTGATLVQPYETYADGEAPVPALELVFTP